MLDPPPADSKGKAACGGNGAPDCDLATLIQEHHVPLYRYAFRLSGNAADAEDLTQQAFVIAHEKLHQLREAGSVRSWLYTVLRNCFLKSRRRSRPVAAESLDLDIESVPQSAPDADDIDRERLQQALDALPDELRLVVLMFYFEECTYKEIAAQLEIPIGTVMSRLSRAKGKLRLGLQQEAVANGARPKQAGKVETDATRTAASPRP